MGEERGHSSCHWVCSGQPDASGGPAAGSFSSIYEKLPVRLSFHSCEAVRNSVSWVFTCPLRSLESTRNSVSWVFTCSLRSLESTHLTHHPHSGSQSWGNSNSNAKRSLDSWSLKSPPRALVPPV